MRSSLLIAAIAGAALLVMNSGSQAKQTQKDVPLTEFDRNKLLDRVFANQHADDDALPLFQRTERRRFRGRETENIYTDDRTVKIVPTGIGSARITLEDHGHPAQQSEIRSQTAMVEHQLEQSMDASNPQTARDRAKYEHRNHERNDLVSEVRKAFLFTWEGWEVRDGRTLARFHLEPNPAYHATSRESELFSHAVATVWIDEKAGQVARLEGELTTDIPFYGGLAAKVYRGGKFSLEQVEVEPGIWLPVAQQYDFNWRKVFFPAEFHERIDDSRYIRVGTPEQELASIRRELSAKP
jgi:hypothetical protein